MTLERLVDGERAAVARVGGTAALRRRLLEIGFRKGAAVVMVRQAPLSDPVEVILHGIHVSLRRSEARAVSVERAD